MKYIVPAAVFVLIVSVGTSLRPGEVVSQLRRMKWQYWLGLVLATFLIPTALALILGRVLPVQRAETAGLFFVWGTPSRFFFKCRSNGWEPGPLRGQCCALAGFSVKAQGMSSITKLPAASIPPQTLPLGVVFLFRDNNWNDRSPLWLTTGSYAPGVRHSIAATNMQDAATWVAFNLPVGQVMTLTDNANPVAPATPVWNLGDCGRCIDLIGTGQTESVDLTQVNMNDCVSSFFWRTVDLSKGAIELYDDANFRGNRNVIFLSEWPAKTVVSMAGWWLAGRVSSVRCTTLPASCVAELFDKTEGSFDYVSLGGSNATELADLSQSQFNDRTVSFRWLIVPAETAHPQPQPHVDPPPTAAEIAQGEAIIEKIRQQEEAAAEQAKKIANRMPRIF